MEIIHLTSFTSIFSECNRRGEPSPSRSIDVLEDTSSHFCLHRTLFGSFAVSKANGWNSPNIDRKAASSILRTFRKDSNSIVKDWGISYTLASIAAGSVLAYGSLYLSV